MAATTAFGVSAEVKKELRTTSELSAYQEACNSTIECKPIDNLKIDFNASEPSVCAFWELNTFSNTICLRLTNLMDANISNAY